MGQVTNQGAGRLRSLTTTLNAYYFFRGGAIFKTSGKEAVFKDVRIIFSLFKMSFLISDAINFHVGGVRRWEWGGTWGRH